jgi:hypothetical protein
MLRCSKYQLNIGSRSKQVGRVARCYCRLGSAALNFHFLSLFV